VGGTPEENGMDDNGILSDVDPESIRTPSPSCLDGVKVSTSFGEGSGTA
jgi:hypothetical protein